MVYLAGSVNMVRDVFLREISLLLKAQHTTPESCILYSLNFAST